MPDKKKKIAWHNWLVAHVLCCSTWRALDCSLWFKWFSKIQGVKGKELQRFLYSLPRMWFKHAHSMKKHGQIYTVHSHTCTHGHTVYTHTLGWCLEGWNSVLKRQAARRSWPSLGTDEQLCQMFSAFLCMRARECVSMHIVNFTAIVHLSSLAPLKLGLNLENCDASLAFSPGAFGQEGEKI